jgi:hypothetical protein
MGVMAITTVIGCKLMCTFCPQILLRNSYNDHKKILSLEDFNKILNKIPVEIDIHFSGNAEPWLNKDATEMLKISLERGHSVGIFTTLVGMSVEDAKKVIDLCKTYSNKMKMFEVHLPDKNNNMPGWRMNEEYENVLKMFISFADEKIIKGFNFMTMDGSNRVHDHVYEIVKNNINQNGGWEPISRGGTLDNVVAPKHDKAVYCSKTAYYDRNILLPNGDISICCQDYGLKHIIGNLITDEYDSLFVSEELNRVKKINMLDGYSDESICKSCEIARPTETFISLNSIYSHRD